MTDPKSEDDGRACLAANHLWALSKLRCKEVYEGKKTNTVHFLALATSYERLQVDASLLKGHQKVPLTYRALTGMATCAVDGSFSEPAMARWSYALHDEVGCLKE